MAFIFRKVRKVSPHYFPGSIQAPRRICLVGCGEDYELRCEAMKFDLPLSVLETNNNCYSNIITTPESRTIYILPDFEKNEALIKVFEYTENAWVLGPTAVRQLVQDDSLLFPNKPLYSTSMYGLCFYINCPKDIPLMRKLTKLIMWMGGLFVSSPNGEMTHMITNSARAKGCKYCWVFNVPMLTPEWVEHCWAQRDNINFTARSSVTKHFLLPMFADLNIAFEGFSDTEYEILEAVTKTNGGVTVSTDSPQCTHLVISNSFCTSDDDIPSEPIYIVKYEWFQQSIECNEKQDEDQYLYFSDSLSKDQIRIVDFEMNTTMDIMMSIKEEDENCVNTSMDAIISSTSIKEENVNCVRKSMGQYGPNKLRKSKSMDLGVINCQYENNNNNNIEKDETIKKERTQKEAVKLKHKLQELIDTESNYQDCLKILMNIKLMSDENSVGITGKKVLSKAEAKLIFGNLENILKLHVTLSGFLERVHDMMMSSTDDVFGQIDIGYGYKMLKEQMKTEYINYSRVVENCIIEFENCVNSNAMFNSIIIDIQNDYKSQQKKIQDPKHLLALPAQRLATTSLLLHGLKQDMPEGPAKESVGEALSIIETILHEMNADMTKRQDLQKVFDIFQCIENCPAHLVTSHRKFITKFSAQEVKGKNEITFFLFTDIIEVTKKQEKSKGLCTPSHSTSRTKMYKHIGQIPLSFIKHILLMEYENDGYETQRNTFGLYVLDPQYKSNTNIYYFKYLNKENENEFVDIIDTIAGQLFNQNIVKSQKEVITKLSNVKLVHFDSLEETLQDRDTSKVKTPLAGPSGVKTDVTSKQNSNIRRSLSCIELHS